MQTRDHRLRYVVFLGCLGICAGALWPRMAEAARPAGEAGSKGNRKQATIWSISLGTPSADLEAGVNDAATNGFDPGLDEDAQSPGEVDSYLVGPPGHPRLARDFRPDSAVTSFSLVVDNTNSGEVATISWTLAGSYQGRNFTLQRPGDPPIDMKTTTWVYVPGTANETLIITVTSAVTVAPEIADIADTATLEHQPYTARPTLTQGTPPVDWSLVAGPTGMTIDPQTGVVSWPDPSPAGSSHTVTIRASNGGGVDDESWVLSVNELVLPPIVRPIRNQFLVAFSSYTGPTPVLLQGTAPIDWSLVAGPTDMTIDPQTGIVEWGSPVTDNSPYAVTIRASNRAGTDDQSWVLTVVTSAESPDIFDIADQSTQVHQPYTVYAQLVQGTEPISWSLVTGPAGMTIDSEAGIVSWADPLTTGSPFTVTIGASNLEGTDEESWLLTVTPPPVAPTIADLPDTSTLAHQPFTVRPVLLAGTPPITWSIVTGPTSMTIDNQTGVVSWPDPVSAGSPYTVTLRAMNTVGPDDESFLLTVNEPAVAPIVNEIADDHSAVLGQPYTGPTPSLAQGTAPVTWSLVAGPLNMTINSQTGVVFWPVPQPDPSPTTVTIRAGNLAGGDNETWRLFIMLADHEFTSGSEGWTWFDLKTTFTAPSHLWTSQSLTITETRPHSNLVFGSWEAPKDPAVGVQPTLGSVLRARYFVRSDAVTPARTPGFRMRGFTGHITTYNGEPIPDFATRDFVDIYQMSYTTFDWAHLRGREPGTTGTLYTFLVYPQQVASVILSTDTVTYFTFDLLDIEAGFGNDAGTLSVDSVVIDAFPRPEIGLGTVVPELTSTTFAPACWIAGVKGIGPAYDSTGLVTAVTNDALAITVADGNAYFEAWIQMARPVRLRSGNYYRMAWYISASDIAVNSYLPTIRTSLLSDRFIWGVDKELRAGSLSAGFGATPELFEMWLAAPSPDPTQVPPVPLTEPMAPRFESWLLSNPTDWPFYANISGTVRVDSLLTEVFPPEP